MINTSIYKTLDEEDKYNYVRATPLKEGMTLYMPDYQSYLEATEKLNEYGFEIQCNTEQLSIYILSCPI